MESFAEGFKNIIFSIKVLCKKFFDIDGDLVFCNNSGMSMTEVSIEHKTEEWRLFLAPQSLIRIFCQRRVLSSVIDGHWLRRLHVKARNDNKNSQSITIINIFNCYINVIPRTK